MHPYLPLPFGPNGYGPRLMQLNDVLVAPLRLISSHPLISGTSSETFGETPRTFGEVLLPTKIT